MSTDTLKLYRQESLGLFEENGLIDHVELAEKFSSSVSGKNLAQKNSGKFYTPEFIASPLIKQVLDISKIRTKKGTVRIIDPFCGDGRLIEWTLPFFKNLDVELEIHLWDYDGDAVERAATKVRKAANANGLTFTIKHKRVDAFSEFFTYENSFDLVITNPPWEVVKPDPKDLECISNESDRNQYVLSLKEFSNRLLRDFPLSKPAKSFGGWGVNLARVGTELSIRLAKDKGGVGIVAPSTIFADQNSYELRKWMFSTNNIENINIYPAELKLFKGVDQPSVSFALIRNGNQKSLGISSYEDLSSPSFHRLTNVHKLLQSTDYILPITVASNPEQLGILSSLSSLPKLSELEASGSLWMGRELDETNHKSWLSLKGKHAFVKGRDVDRFYKLTAPKVFINEEVLKTSLPNSIQYHRIVWRDVSRPNQKRRVIATMVPPGYVTGNSLGVLHVHEQDNQKNLMALLGLMSSFVFEFQLRAYLATAHVSAGVMKKVSIPTWSAGLVDNISNLIETRLNGILSAEHEIEVAIARAYGLNRGQFDEILGAFPKVTDQEKSMLLNPALWN